MGQYTRSLLKTGAILSTQHAMPGPKLFSLTSSTNFPIKAAFDALRYLMAKKVEGINRQFRMSKLPLSVAKGHWIWEGYTSESEISRVTNVLNNSVEEYPEFINGNHLHFPNSPYLDSHIAIVFEYEPYNSKTPNQPPTLIEYRVNNPKHILPKVSVYIKNSTVLPLAWDYKSFKLKVNDNEYTCAYESQADGSFLFGIIPVMNMIYQMFCHDFSSHYGFHLHYNEPYF